MNTSKTQIRFTESFKGILLNNCSKIIRDPVLYKNVFMFLYKVHFQQPVIVVVLIIRSKSPKESIYEMNRSTDFNVTGLKFIRIKLEN